MTKLTKRLSQLFASVLSGIFALLGFSACTGEDDPEVILMYGTPTAGYELKGSVTNESGQPVQSRVAVEVYRSQDPEGKTIIVYDTVYTDVDGCYNWVYKDFPYYVNEKPQAVCDVPDSDYEPDTVYIQWGPLTGGHGWWTGTSHAIADFNLKKRPQDQ